MNAILNGKKGENESTASWISAGAIAQMDVGLQSERNLGVD
jgi:hypothetical protein